MSEFQWVDAEDNIPSAAKNNSGNITYYISGDGKLHARGNTSSIGHWTIENGVWTSVDYGAFPGTRVAGDFNNNRTCIVGNRNYFIFRVNYSNKLYYTIDGITFIEDTDYATPFSSTYDDVWLFYAFDTFYVICTDDSYAETSIYYWDDTQHQWEYAYIDEDYPYFAWATPFFVNNKIVIAEADSIYISNNDGTQFSHVLSGQNNSGCFLLNGDLYYLGLRTFDQQNNERIWDLAKYDIANNQMVEVTSAPSGIRNTTPSIIPSIFNGNNGYFYDGTKSYLFDGSDWNEIIEDSLPNTIVGDSTIIHKFAVDDGELKHYTLQAYTPPPPPDKKIKLDYGMHKIGINVGGERILKSSDLESVEITYGCTDGTAPGFGATYSPHCEVVVNETSIVQGNTLANIFKSGVTFTVKCDIKNNEMGNYDEYMYTLGKFKIQEPPQMTDDYQFSFSGDGKLATKMATTNMDFSSVSGTSLAFTEACALVGNQFSVYITLPDNVITPLPTIYLPFNYKKTKKSKTKVLANIKARDFIAGLALIIGANAVEVIGEQYDNSIIRLIDFGSNYNDTIGDMTVDKDPDYFVADDYQAGYSYCPSTYAPKSLVFLGYDQKKYTKVSGTQVYTDGFIVVKGSKTKYPSIYRPFENTSGFVNVEYDTEVECTWLSKTIQKLIDAPGRTPVVSHHYFKYSPSTISFSGWNQEWFQPGNFLKVQKISKDVDTQTYYESFFTQFVMEMRFRWTGTIAVDISSSYNGTELKVTNNIDGGDINTFKNVEDNGAEDEDNIYPEEGGGGGGGGGGGDTPTTLTLRLDVTDRNPLTWGEWLDDAIGMTELTNGCGVNEVDELMDYYVCTLDSHGNEVDRVNPDDYSKTTDGNPLTNPDCVMVRFAPRGFRIQWHDSNHLDISITSEASKIGYTYPSCGGFSENEFYVAAYRCNSVNNTIDISKSGTNASIIAMDKAHSILGSGSGNGYGILDNIHLMYLQCCLLIKYKGAPTYKVGYNPSLATDTINGLYDDKGLNYGSGYVHAGFTADAYKQFGIEFPFFETLIDGVFFGIPSGTLVQWYNDQHELEEGYFFNSGIDGNMYGRWMTNGFIENPEPKLQISNNGSYNYTGYGYLVVPWEDTGLGWIKIPAGNNNIGFIPSERNAQSDASETTYFCGGTVVGSGSIYDNMYGSVDSSLKVGFHFKSQQFYEAEENLWKMGMSAGYIRAMYHRTTGE